MKAPSKRNKKYRPKRIDPTAAFRTMCSKLDDAADALPMRNDQTTDLGIAYHMAFEAFVKGDGTEEIWHTLVCALNIAMVLAEQGLGKEFEADFVLALDGVFRAKVRAARTDRWALDGDAITAVRRALAVHDEQLVHAQRAAVRLAIEEVHRRQRSGLVYREAA